ncbi:MAG: citrate synthase [Elusimicrobia bacterium]|nr:citrate synthase [Elusimicrobiota bacterium]
MISMPPKTRGLEGIIAGASAIGEVDPRNERLIYRGYDVRDLAQQASYEEVAYLLIFGRLPTQAELAAFTASLVTARPLDLAVLDLLRRMAPTVHPMDRLRTAVSWLGAHDPEVSDNSHEANASKATRLIAQIPSLVAAGYRLSQGQPPIPPRSELSHAENFLFMMTGRPPDTLASRVFNTSLILYAEHGFNASTFAARVTVSTLSDLHAAVTSAIGALKGALHGGANEGAIQMLLEIGEPSRVDGWLRDALAQKKRIMGFGHRIYKRGDTRVPIMKPLVRELAEQLGGSALKLRETAERVETIMRQTKNILSNVDFPTGLAYYLLGLPLPVYTPIFAAARMAGWGAHIIEQMDDNRLIRPESQYTGPHNLPYIPLTKR